MALKILQKKEIVPFPFPVYFWTIVSLVFIGLAVSIYLFISHYRIYTDIGYRSFCAITQTINCDTVSQSPHSIFLSLPLSIWGVIGYSLLLLLLFFARGMRFDRNRIWPLLLLLSLLFSGYSIYLSLISIFYIKSYCIMCIATYGVNFLILYYIWLIRRRFDPTHFIHAFKHDVSFLWANRKTTFSILGFFLLGIVFLQVLIPPYWRLSPPTLAKAIPTGITESGHPWIGGKNPVLTITEFADYQCFQCKKMHFHLRALIAKHPERIRLIHRHFPMDQKVNPIVKQQFHVGSGTMAVLAIYALSKNKFWDMNDALYEIADQEKAFNTRNLAQKIGLDVNDLSRAINNPILKQKLQRDIFEGFKIGITGTPAFIVDDRVFFGQLPPEIIKKAIE